MGMNTKKQVNKQTSFYWDEGAVKKHTHHFIDKMKIGGAGEAPLWGKKTSLVSPWNDVPPENPTYQNAQDPFADSITAESFMFFHPW
jgi:hypothetical protein